MKRFFGIIAAMLLVLSVIPVMAVSTGSGTGIDITPEHFHHTYGCVIVELL